MQKVWITAGALAGLSAVALSALVAHALPGRLGPAELQQVRDAVQLQFWHAIMLVVCGLYAPRGGLLTQLAAGAFLLGLLLFCGAVYALDLGGVRLTSAAPAGGFVLMAGWLLLAVAGLRAR